MYLALGFAFSFFASPLQTHELLKSKVWPSFVPAAELDSSARTLFALPALCYHLAKLSQLEVSWNLLWQQDAPVPDLSGVAGYSLVL